VPILGSLTGADCVLAMLLYTGHKSIDLSVDIDGRFGAEHLCGFTLICL
jgi:hypothetical protein